MSIQRLESLKAEIANCTKCPLHRHRDNTVFGDGNIEAKIFLIGEGPGYEEDRQGRAFVGRSGQFLDRILAACNFSRSKHVFIGNIVKCRPPENRTPANEEMAACLPYLEEQIELINPSIIILLGATALRGLFGNTMKITQARGNWLIWNNRLVMPTYHPSALLRNPNLKKDAWEDFKKVILKYRELVDAGHKCEHI
jgi:DNA polymerase